MRRIGIAVVSIVVLLTAAPTHAEGEPPLEEFGRGATVAGPRPLLTIMLDFQGMPFSTTHTVDFYRRLLFRQTTRLDGAIAGPGSFMAEASSLRFHFSDAGFIGPVTAPDDPTTTGNEALNECAYGFLPGCTGGTLKLGAHAIAGAVKRGYDFARHDRNGDSVVTSDELTVLMIGAAAEGETHLVDADVGNMYIATEPGPGKIALHRWRNGWTGDIVETTAWPGVAGDRRGNHEYVELVGYIWTSPVGQEYNLYYSESRGDYAPNDAYGPPQGTVGKPRDYVLVQREGYVRTTPTAGTKRMAFRSVVGDTGQGGANRGTDPGCVPANAGVHVCVTVAGVGEAVGAATLAHELVHNLGVGWEAYGPNCNSYWYTTMSCTIDPGRDTRWIVGLDPFTKLRLGWIDPPVLSTRSTGCYTLLPATVRPGLGDRRANQYLLYDPTRGTDDLLLLEYRVARPYSYDGDPFETGAVALPEEGLAIWVVRKTDGGDPAEIADPGGGTEAAMQLYPPDGRIGNPGIVDGLWSVGNAPARPRWFGGVFSRATIRVVSINSGRELRFALGAERPECAGPEPSRSLPQTVAGGVVGGPCSLAGRTAVCTVDTPLFRARRTAPATFPAGGAGRLDWTITPKRPLNGTLVIETPWGSTIRPTSGRRTTVKLSGRKARTVKIPFLAGSVFGRLSLGATLRYRPAPGEHGLVRRLRANVIVASPALAKGAQRPLFPGPPVLPPDPEPTPMPDLVIAQLTKTGFTVRNQGAAPAGAFTVRITVGGQPVHMFTFAKGLPAGQTDSGAFSCLVATFTATADAGGQVAESNEGNNATTVTNTKCP